MSYEGDDRRVEKRRELDTVCRHHEADSDKIEHLTKMVPKMNTKINIGVGVVISAMCIATVLFSSMDTFKREAEAAQEKHEVTIAKEQGQLQKQIVSIETNVNSLTVDMAVVSSQLDSLRNELAKDRAELLVYLKSLDRKHNE